MKSMGDKGDIGLFSQIEILSGKILEEYRTVIADFSSSCNFKFLTALYLSDTLLKNLDVSKSYLLKMRNFLTIFL